MAKGKYADLVGQRFGRLSVVDRLPNKNGRVYWKCLCDCGLTSEVMTNALTTRITTSCGCFHREVATKDITGQQIGKWSVISKSHKRSSKGYVYWQCRCSCGTERLVCAESLLSGKSNGCSHCAQAPKKRQICINGHDTHVWGRSEAGTCRACVKDKHLRTHYGISLEEFIALYEKQNGKCAICEKELGSYLPKEPGFGKACRIEVDHDHKKGKRVSVRGLLCGGRWAGCNRKLGRIDNIPWLKRVIAYLDTPPATTVVIQN